MSEHSTSAIERSEPFYSTSAVQRIAAPSLVTVLPLQSLVIHETEVKCVEIAEDQAWYWTAGWQMQEREAEADLELGHYEDFETMDDFIASL